MRSQRVVVALLMFSTAGFFAASAIPASVEGAAIVLWGIAMACSIGALVLAVKGARAKGRP